MQGMLPALMGGGAEQGGCTRGVLPASPMPCMAAPLADSLPPSPDPSRQLLG